MSIPIIDAFTWRILKLKQPSFLHLKLRSFLSCDTLEIDFCLAIRDIPLSKFPYKYLWAKKNQGIISYYNIC